MAMLPDTSDMNDPAPKTPQHGVGGMYAVEVTGPTKAEFVPAGVPATLPIR